MPAGGHTTSSSTATRSRPPARPPLPFSPLSSSGLKNWAPCGRRQWPAVSRLLLLRRRRRLLLCLLLLTTAALASSA